MRVVVHAPNILLYSTATRLHMFATVDEDDRPTVSLCGGKGKTRQYDPTKADCSECVDLRSRSKRWLLRRAREMRA